MKNNVYIVDFQAYFDEEEWAHNFTVHFDEKDAIEMADYFKRHPEQYRHISITHYVKSGEIEL